MADAAKRASTLTTLAVGKVEMEVGLFAAHAKPGSLAEFTTAGPSGGVLKAVAAARAVPVGETVEQPDVPVGRADPLADDPGPEAPPIVADNSLPPGTLVGSAQVDGEYGRQLVEEGTGEIVPPDNVRRGVRLADGSFIDCTEQLAAITDATKLDRMTVVGFVDATRVHRARVVKSDYLGAADEKAPKPMRLIYEALKAERRAAVVKLTRTSRQSLGVIVAYGDTLMLHQLAWAEDFRQPPPKALAIQKASVSEQEVARARELVHAMGASVTALDELRDDALALREVLHGKALAGEVAEVVTPPEVVESQDVMASLEASLAGVAG